ncbi:hypothetical protein EJ08DRAFT_688319 [Tothia fuscella]|uniref:D-serine dehydratase n=1 Tax=Tothia fuscella TaxID=1048955 RepID=A0A9P4NQP9_9PEZI|nr:hypothetical protein EJ08DRAFT_688319 [Tothia fuscella]
MASPIPILSSLLYQSSSDAGLKAQFIGQRLDEIQTPAAILDVAIVRRNCSAMLDAAAALKMQFRAHVKTHKTAELTSLQVGPTGPIRIITSTISEIEHLIPYLLAQKTAGRSINVLYGLPASPSSLPRLAKLAHVLGGTQAISVLIDHPDTSDFISQSHELWPGGEPIRVFVKIDSGYHRSGTNTKSPVWKMLLEKIEKREGDGTVRVVGLYSHFGHSYRGNTPEDALVGLKTEFETLEHAAKEMESSLAPKSHLTFSVGATPTATAAQTLLGGRKSAQVEGVGRKNKDIRLELHAGVYPILDLQQMATHARPSKLSYEDLGLRILAEVASLYPDRAKPEALIAAGSLVLGREPCKAYSGWGILTSYPQVGDELPVYDFESKTGWIVNQVSQEHGVLSWEGPRDHMRELKIGEKVMIWPNHACVAGVGFGWYYVVDSDEEDPDVIKDVWVRCRGW